MPVTGLNHINIRTPDYARALAFFQEALGMRAVAVPGRDEIDEAAWICDDTGFPVLHMASAEVRYSSSEILPPDPPRGSGAIHHIAFSRSDYSTMRDRLTQLNVGFRENVPAEGNRQMLVEAPYNIMLELNFSE